MEQVKILEITDGVYNTYKRFIKGNQNDSRELAQRKLTRNVLSGTLIKKDNLSETYAYGCLYITVSNGKVIYLQNNQDEVPIDQELKAYWTKELGLDKKPALLHKVKQFLMKIA